jgi:2,4-dienoyl-CoA reductase-like NADH-dependent reductase (Old Yellow Enzyme family)
MADGRTVRDPVPDTQNPPVALDRTGLAEIRNAFAAAATRAARLGIDAVQLHGAHGYLLHEFLSPLSNRREDEYGGSLENRLRFPLEVFDAVRAAFPPERPVSLRVSGTDWASGGWDIDQTITFAKALEAHGCSALHVSSGGLTPTQQIPLGRVRCPPRAISDRPAVIASAHPGFDQAEAIMAPGTAGPIALARHHPRAPARRLISAHRQGTVSILTRATAIYE